MDVFFRTHPMDELLVGLENFLHGKWRWTLGSNIASLFPKITRVTRWTKMAHDLPQQKSTGESPVFFCRRRKPKHQPCARPFVRSGFGVEFWPSWEDVWKIIFIWVISWVVPNVRSVDICIHTYIHIYLWFFSMFIYWSRLENANRLEIKRSWVKRFAHPWGWWLQVAFTPFGREMHNEW